MKLLYFAVFLMVTTSTSAGIVEQLKNIHVVMKAPTIPQFRPLEIRVNGLGTALGWKKNVTSSSDSTTTTSTSTTTTKPSTTTPFVKIQQPNNNETSKPVTKVPSNIRAGCGDYILLDLHSKKPETTFHSTQFPNSRSAPYACSWDVRVSKSCPRAQITMTVNAKSRLAFSSNCNRGYFRVSPFMQDAKVCGNISLVPEFKWVVDDQQETVNIVMKNIGLSDGKPEGISFTMSGECINEKSTVDAPLHNNELASKWLVTTSKVKGVSIFTRKAIEPTSKLSSKISVVGEEDDSANGPETAAVSTIVLSDDTAAAVASIAAAMTHDHPSKPVSSKTTKKPFTSTTTKTSTSSSSKQGKPTTKPTRTPSTKSAKRRPSLSSITATSTTTTTAAPKTEHPTTSAPNDPVPAEQSTDPTTPKPQRIINPLFALFRRLHWL